MSSTQRITKYKMGHLHALYAAEGLALDIVPKQIWIKTNIHEHPMRCLLSKARHLVLSPNINTG